MPMNIPIPEEIFYTLQTIWEIIKVWWWLPLPFIIWGTLKYHYLYYIKERWDSKIKKILLEIKMPKDVTKPIRAMDQVFANFHSIHDIPLPREEWIEGVFQASLSLEIVSIGGEIHFYIRTPEMFRSVIESGIYSQYPNAEISLADDYTKYVPQDIPNKDWDIWAVDFVNAKDEIYPIKTYKQFETESEKVEEKRIDPLAGFLESMAALGPGEQAWLQIRIKPVLGRDNPWQKRGRELADKLARRPEKEKLKPIIQEAAEIIISGKKDQETKEKEVFPPEMRLTPGEKEVLTAVEEKLSKFGYDCSIRFAYLAKRDVFFKPRVKGVFSFFKETSTENLGGLKPSSNTMTKVKSVPFWFLDKRRFFLRQRRMFRYYIKRMPPLFPRPGMTFILNTEELATLYHFPGELVVSTLAVPRVEAKKKEAPPDLPVG